jgi:hypothetical protein
VAELVLVTPHCPVTTLTIERLLADLPRAKTTADDHVGYKHFLEFFTRLSSIDAHAFVISACFTYSWMPRKLTLDFSLVERATQVVQAASRPDNISADDLALLVRCINHSLVGASKLLHFASPKSYPIWDSRVFRYIYGRRPSQNQISHVPSYFTYRQTLLRFASDARSETIQQSLSEQIGYPVTTLRALEVLMYLLADSTKEA